MCQVSYSVLDGNDDAVQYLSYTGNTGGLRKELGALCVVNFLEESILDREMPSLLFIKYFQNIIIFSVLHILLQF